jgi:methionyl-tRNA synthetase
MNKSVYITTTLPYVNADPHIGFALEIVHADIYARFNRLIGNEVFFNTGTDEHGQKIFEKAKEEGMDTQDYVDEFAAKFDNLKDALNLSFDSFIRTTDAHHITAAQAFWNRCKENGDIYKKLYKVKYCVGCELEKTDSELEKGRCPLHPTKDLEVREEENYFFKFSKYQDKLLSFYAKRPDFVVPDFRFNEIKAFVKRGLEDFSISRLKEKMSWGVPVPDDPDHVMYVWFDALINYISAPGWPHDKEAFLKRWPVIQFAGKDNLRQQSAMWQAMLLSAGFEPSKQIVIHGFINSGGAKMSKSLGNVVNPYDLIKEYGTDAVRYYLARHIHPFEDSDYTDEKFKEYYTAHLVNGLGNLVSRVLTMAESYGVRYDGPLDLASHGKVDTSYLKNFEFNKYMDEVWKIIGEADAYIQKEEPFKKVKKDKEGAVKDVQHLLGELHIIEELISPVMPQTSLKIKSALKITKKPDESLFPRK